MEPLHYPSVGVSGISERDVDLLLLEEFASSPRFVEWFASKVSGGAQRDLQVLSTNRSVTQSLGESDLEVFVEGDGRIECLLIENKVGAGFQPRQAERYRERGALYVEDGSSDAFATILVAPLKYLGPSPDDLKGFDATVSYEDIRDWIEGEESLGARGKYKQTILQGAITKATLGYQPEEDASVSEFWKSYWHLAREHAPELEMQEPTPKPAGAGFVYFSCSSLPSEVRLVHKMVYGRMDLQFKGMGQKLKDLHAQYGAALDPDMSIQRAAKSGVIRLKVPTLNPSQDFEAQAEDVISCLRKGAELLNWFQRVAIER
jgi:hypothetical protein